MRRTVFLLSLLLVLSAAAQQTGPVRGTWITNVASDALRSRQKVRAAVQRCRQLGLNNIYVVVWNNGRTMYPSDVVEGYTGLRQDPVYKGFDPIACIVREGHKAGLKVHAWFEFGFAYAYKDSSSEWLRRYPHWAGCDARGNLLQKNGFYWWNSLNPEVQGFMQQLVLEVVRKYKVDGVQGDDRLPAMPSEGGYDSYTLARYAQEHNGAAPPSNAKDSAWIQWRADKLSAYIKELYGAVKQANASCIVSWAPSIYPWSKEQYLQDWPAWLHGGYADEVLPQLYRYDLAAYEQTLRALDAQVTAAEKRRVFPGILIALGDGFQVKQEMLDAMIALNRRYGFMGECLFYFEGLKKLKPFYPAKK